MTHTRATIIFLEHQMEAIGWGLVGRPDTRSYGNWREALALARLSAVRTGKRYGVKGYKNSRGEWVYDCGPLIVQPS